MISTRSSGSSFKNRVELQNGCLALGHANLFIPSTLNGSCMDSGKVNEEILCKNLDAAIDVYISRVDKTPCARTEIHLMKGANGQKEREILLIFLKGTKEAKEKAKLKEPDLYNGIERIWQLRTRHLVQGLPIHYVFYLKCCYQRDCCIHPTCKADAYDKNNDVWYPGGPSPDYFPSPTPDPDRPDGNESCTECVGFCAGHYLKSSKLLSIGKQLPDAVPPSQVLAQVFKDSVGFPTDELINATAEKVLLKPEDVRIWFQHLQTVETNRKKGAKKAAATRKAKARSKDLRKKTVLRDSDEDEVCNSCYSFNPPDVVDENFDWVACDTCALWYHACCVELGNIPAVWFCSSCMQQ